MTARSTVEWKLKWQWSKNRCAVRVRWSNGISYNRSMLEYKVIKFPPRLFSILSNTAMSRKTQAPDRHWWKLLPGFCLWRPGLWTIQATSDATVEWQLEWQWSNSRNVGRVRWSQGLIYNCSMLEYKVIKFPPWQFLWCQTLKWAGRHTCLTVTNGNHYPDSASWGNYREKTKQHQEQQWSDRWSDSGATAGVLIE